MTPRLLVIDDDDAMLQALSSMVELRMPEINTETCDSAHAALKRIHEVDYDVIVSDVKMPVMDGLHLMEQILHMRPSTPTLLVTGHGDHDMGVRALEAGAYAFIPKPIDRDYFIAWIKRALHLRQLSRQVQQQNEELSKAVESRTIALEETNESLKRAQRRLIDVTESANCGLWDWNIPHGTLEWFGGLVRMAGLQWSGFSGTIDAFTNALHPDDRARVWVRLKDLMARRTVAYTDEYRFAHPDGAVRWMAASGEFRYGANGAPLRMTGVVTDITARKEAESTVLETEERYRRLVKLSPDGIYIHRDNRIVFINEAGLKLFGAERREQILERSPFDLFHEDYHPALRERMDYLFNQDDATTLSEERVVRLDGSAVDVEVSASSFLDQGMRSIHVVLHDITARKRAENDSRAHRELMDTVVNQLPSGVAIIRGRDLRFQLVNPAYRLIAPGKDMVGRFIHDVWPETHPLFSERCRRVLETGEPYHAIDEPFSVSRSTAGALERAYFSWSMHRVTLPADDGHGILVTVSETTERKRADKALRDSLQQYQSTFDNAAVGMSHVGLDGRWLKVNDRLCDITGYSRDELLSGKFEDITHPDDVEADWVQAKRVLADEIKTYSLEKRYVHKDGRIIWILLTVSLVHDVDRSPKHFISIVEDITARKQIEEALRVSEQRLGTIVNQATVGIAQTDLTGKFVLVNQRYCDIVGYHQAELLQMFLEDVSHPADIIDEHRLFQGMVRDGEGYVTEMRYVRKDKTPVWVSNSVSLVHDSKGRPEYAVAIVLDITSRREAEAALEESEERFRTLADNMSQLAWMADANAVIFWYNRRWYEYTGTTLPQMQGEGWQQVHHPAHVDRVVKTWQKAHETSEAWEDTFPLRAHDGTYRWFLSRALPIRDENGRVIRWFGTNTDVTEQRAAEEALREGEQRLRLAQQAGRIGSFEWNIQTGMNVWTRELEVMYGLSSGTFPKSQAAWESLLHPDDRVEALRQVQRALDTGQPGEAEWRVVWPDGSVHWLAGRWQVFKDECGNPLRLSGVNMDITTRKQSEADIRRLLLESQDRARDLREKQEQLVQAAKLASIGELASGVAHELNNPLNNIGLILGNALERLGGGSVDRSHIRQALENGLGQVHRASAIIDHLRTFARTASTPFEPVAIHRVMRSAVYLVEADLRASQVKLSMTLCSDDPCVLGNVIQLEQVFINLLTNARDAVAQADKKVIEMASRIRRNRVEVTVRDTGTGIPSEHHARIFDPFFTTKDVGRGTGLGLSISYSIIQEHGGDVTVESQPAQGSTFIVALPIATDVLLASQASLSIH